MKYLLFSLMMYVSVGLSAQKYSTQRGSIEFTSDAPLELITAKSTSLKGVLDVEQKSFAFKMSIRSFKGFNSPLQQTHFYENYMETDLYPHAIFQGKIIESLNLSTAQTYRAKGELEIHGVSVERIIEVKLYQEGDSIRFESEFMVPLADHEIELPRIVYQKIAEEIYVEVKGELSQ